MPTTDSLDSTIQALKKELAESQLVDQLKSQRIGELEKRAGEARKIIDDYGKAVDGLLEQHKSSGKYYQSKSEMITKVLNTNVQANICQHIDRYDKNIGMAEKVVKDLGTAVTTAYEDVSKKTTAHDGRVKEFESLKGFQKTVENGFKSLNELTAEIEQLDDGTNNEVMFFLITDLYKRSWCADLIEHTPDPKIESLEKLDKVTKDKIKGLVEKAWNDLNAAKTTLNAAKKTLSMKQDELTAASAKLEELNSKRRQDIEKWIKDNLDMLRNLPDPTPPDEGDNPC